MDNIKNWQNKMAKPLHRTIAASVIVASLLMVFFTTTNASITLGEQKPADAFTTNVVGVTTNAATNPITLNGYYFTTHNIQNYVVPSDDNGIVTIVANNFVPAITFNL